MGFCVLAAGGAMSFLTVAIGIILFLLSLGAVVFFHELGHFMLAKWVGIKVERFAIGMGPRVWGIKRGETDYCICAFPIGGYVKMLGQEDVKALEDIPEDQIDPRSYNAKSVGARFSVISAGVIMNLIVAAIVFIVLCMIGMQFIAPVVGGVAEGSPADKLELIWNEPLPADPKNPGAGPRNKTTGLESGDRILELDNDEVMRYRDVRSISALSGVDDEFQIKISRTIDGKVYTGTGIISIMEGIDPASGIAINQFGIGMPRSLTIITNLDYKAEYPFEENDVLRKINGIEIKNSWDRFQMGKDLLARPGPLPNKTELTIDRDSKSMTVSLPLQLFSHHYAICLKETGEMYKVEPSDRKAGEEENSTILTLGKDKTRSVKDDQLTQPATKMLDILGMSPRTVINGVNEGSPADKQGLQPNDVVLSWADTKNPTPDQMLTLNKKAADHGAEMLILRDGKSLLPISIKPKERNNSILLGIVQGADIEHAVVASIRENSPAAKAGIKKGDQILSVNDKKIITWIDVFNELRAAQQNGKPVTIKLKGSDKPVEFGKLAQSVFNPACYSVSLVDRSGFMFDGLKTEKLKKGPVDAIGWGVGEVWYIVRSSYQTLISLAKRDVSPELVSGPVGMGHMAVKLTQEGPIKFLYFMAIISASLAVINFLPFPVVDGGHAVFLLIEKVRGKPVPVKIQNISQIIGIVMLLGVFVLITWNDIAKLIASMW